MIAVTGTSAHMPPKENAVTNENLCQIIENKNPEWISESLGIKERRFFTKVSKDTGKPVKPMDETKIAAKAAEEALQDAILKPEEVDRLVFISCTQNQKNRLHFGLEAMDTHNKLGLPSNTTVREMDAGCGGFVYAMNESIKALRGSDEKTALIVAVNVTSNHFHPDYENTSNAWLSTYIFGDGAGAMVLENNSSAGEKTGVITDTYSEVRSETPLMLFRQTENNDKQFYEVQRSVAGTYVSYMKLAMAGMANLRNQTLDELIDAVDVIFAHQANARLLEKLERELNITSDETRVPRNVDCYGNIATATIPVLIDETSLHEGDICLLAVVGAGAQIASALMRV
jgi:3-oxoacyl-(acyl-carrier-protein) synthase III